MAVGWWGLGIQILGLRPYSFSISIVIPRNRDLGPDTKRWNDFALFYGLADYVTASPKPRRSLLLLKKYDGNKTSKIWRPKRNGESVMNVINN